MIPLKLTTDWSPIPHTIMPVINQPLLCEHGESTFGPGDIHPAFFPPPAHQIHPEQPETELRL